ncbi:hypothetical protein LV469_01365 [Peptoniphilus sp. GNH]|nr:hypothetical protein LV469_01365 [Peptoniphilus sp. GNH]
MNFLSQLEYPSFFAGMFGGFFLLLIAFVAKKNKFEKKSKIRGGKK